MITIRILKTGVIKKVDRNVAHDLIDKGEAEIVTKMPPKNVGYNTRQSRPNTIK